MFLLHQTIASDVYPFIVVCGEIKSISAIYVVLDKTHTYKVQKLIEAVDILVKFLILVKNGKSKLLKHIIQFFEYYIYEINEKGIYKNVSQFVKQLKAINV